MKNREAPWYGPVEWCTVIEHHPWGLHVKTDDSDIIGVIDLRFINNDIMHINQEYWPPHRHPPESQTPRNYAERAGPLHSARERTDPTRNRGRVVGIPSRKGLARHPERRLTLNLRQTTKASSNPVLSPETEAGRAPNAAHRSDSMRFSHRGENTSFYENAILMSKSAMKYLSGVVTLLLLSTLAGEYLQGALRISICAAAVLGMLYLVARIAREE